MIGRVVCILILVVSVLPLVLAGCSSDSDAGGDKWYSDGTLHNATATQWRGATYRNKLATAGDWLAASVWNGHLKSPDDFDKMKLKSQMLVNAVDEVVNGKETESLTELKVSGIAAAIIVMSNDIGP